MSLPTAAPSASLAIDFPQTELPVQRGHQTVIRSMAETAETRRCSIPQGGVGEAHLALKCH